MKNEYQLSRHTELWERQNKQVKRVILAGLILGYILLFNILTPYSERIQKITTDVSTAKLALTDSELEIDSLVKLEKILGTVQAVIGRQPWKKEIEDLKAKMIQLNDSGGQDITAKKKQEAGLTVAKIDSMVQNSVNQPFESFKDNTILKDYLPELPNKLISLHNDINRWKNDIETNTNWYRTVPGKNATIQILTDYLSKGIKEVSDEIKSARPQIASKIEKLNEAIKGFKSQIAKEKEELSEKLDTEMAKILPSWIGGIIAIDQIMLYPFLILGIVIYAIVLAFELTRHYHFMISGQNISTEISSDAALSSLWTLTNRGRVGTVVTLACYLAFILIMWYFYEQGLGLFEEWPSNEAPPLLGEKGPVVSRWLGRAVLLLLTSLVLWWPFKKK